MEPLSYTEISWNGESVISSLHEFYINDLIVTVVTLPAVACDFLNYIFLHDAAHYFLQTTSAFRCNIMAGVITR